MPSEPSAGNFVSIRDTAVLWRAFGDRAHKKHYKKNALIWNAGEVIDHLCFICSGEVRMEYTTLDGRTKDIVYFGTNTLVGEVSFFLRKPGRSSFVASQPTTLWLFSRECVDAILATSPQLMQDVFVTMASKSRVLNEQLVTLTLDDVTVRLCKLLHTFATRTGENTLEAVLPWKGQKVASLLGVHRSTIHKSLKDLEAQGVLVEMGPKHFLIHNELLFFRIISESR